MPEFIFGGKGFEGNKTEGKLSPVSVYLITPLLDMRRHTLQAACKYIHTDRLALCCQSV